MRQAVVRALTVNNSSRLGGLMLRQAMPVLVVVIAFWLMRDKVAALDFARIWASVGEVSSPQWVAALGATGASFWAIGRYDAVVHGLLGTRISARSARLSGATAVAISQFAGFGALTASLVRWRMVPDLPLIGALRVSAFVTVSFLLGWAFVTCLAVAALGGVPALPLWIAVIGSVAGVLGLAMPFVVARLPRAFPSSAAMVKIVVLVTLDLVFAGLALYVLLPPDMAVALAPFLVAFSIALVAGLISGTPGGIGAFELCLLAQMPGLALEPLVAAALAFRVVYHLVPALLAGVFLVIGTRKTIHQSVPTLTFPRVPHLPPRLELTLWDAPFAEVKLLRQGDFGVMTQGDHAIAPVAPLSQSLIMLIGPFARNMRNEALLRRFTDMARSGSRAPVVYKACPHLAALGRGCGWRVARIANEALILTAGYDHEGSAKRQLRRILRKAETAGVEVAEAGLDVPWSDMAQINAEWEQANGHQRGFSMGQFDERYVKYQRVFVARREGAVVGFVSFHETKDQWVLDLMRQRKDAGDGVMHALVDTAIQTAKTLAVRQVSLAATQVSPKEMPIGMRKVVAFGQLRSGAQGLIRFKESFAPRWQGRYLVAPSWYAMALGLWDITRRIHGKPRNPLLGDLKFAHKDHQ